MVLAECVSVPVTRVVPVPLMAPPDHVPEPIVRSPAPVSVPASCSPATLAALSSVTCLPAGMMAVSPAAGTCTGVQFAAVVQAPLAPV